MLSWKIERALTRTVTILTIALTKIARGRSDVGQPLTAKGAREIARAALAEADVPWLASSAGEMFVSEPDADERYASELIGHLILAAGGEVRIRRANVVHRRFVPFTITHLPEGDILYSTTGE